MADRFPLIVDNSTQSIKELDSADNLNLTGNNAIFGDGDKAIFGAGSDLQIYHDGLGSYIDEVGTGSLYIRGTNLVLASDTGETYMNGTANGAVTLRYDNSQKLATTATGIDVTGNISAATVTLTGNLDMQDGDKILLGTSDDLQLYHDGTRSWVADIGAGDLRLSTVNGAEIALVSGVSNEYMLQAVADGAVTLYYDNSAKLATTSYGVSVTGSAVASTFTGSVSGTALLDFNAYQNFVLTLTGNITLSNPTTEKVGQSGFITIIHSGAGRTVSLGTDYETAGGAGLTLSATAGATDIVPYIVAASGRILLGTPQLNFS